MIQSDIIKLASEFVSYHPLAVLSTVSNQGEPWGSAVYMGCDSDFNLYFTTKSNTVKHSNILQNNKVCAVFVDEKHQGTLQTKGSAEHIHSPHDVNLATNLLSRTISNSEDWMPPLAKLNGGQYEVYKIIVTYARLSRFGDRRKKEQPQIWEFKR